MLCYVSVVSCVFFSVRSFFFFCVCVCVCVVLCFFFQAEDGIRDLVRSRGLGDVYKRQPHGNLNWLGPIYSMITVSQDVFCIAIIVGVIWAAIRRLSGNIKRLVVSPSEQRDAMIILTLIFVIVTSLFLTNASRLGANEEYSWAIRPISGLLHPLFTNGNFSKIVFETSWWLHILVIFGFMNYLPCLLYTSPSPRDRTRSRMPSSA